MMRKLRDLQGQLDERSNDISKKDSKILMLEAEKDTAIKRLRDAQGTVFESSRAFSCFPIYQVCTLKGEQICLKWAICLYKRGKEVCYLECFANMEKKVMSMP